ncbi:MAG: hypothetical protein SCJ94_08850 [Bacillota bacterium]|nr:hypothetical protein [Bacillota bacterium]
MTATCSIAIMVEVKPIHLVWREVSPVHRRAGEGRAPALLPCWQSVSHYLAKKAGVFALPENENLYLAKKSGNL